MLARVAHLYRSTFGQAMCGAALLWLALPLPAWLSRWFGPIAPNVDTGPALAGQAPLPGPWFLTLAWLAWVAPAWWVVLARRPELPGRRPYLALWLVGFVFWLAELHWLTLPYWATSFGWVALSFYLAFYLPVFVGLTRVAVHGLRISVVVAAPVVWTGLELARGHLLTGVTMASLGHTQYRWSELIQISDLAGAYGVGFLVMLVAACAARMVPVGGSGIGRGAGRERTGPLSLREKVRVRGATREPSRQATGCPHPSPLPKGEGAFWPLLPAALAIVAALLYGHFRMSDSNGTEDATGPAARIALIQSCVDTEVKDDPGKKRVIMEQCCRLSAEALHRYGKLDLIVWPETMFRDAMITSDEEPALPSGWDGSPQEFRDALAKRVQAGPETMVELAKALDTPLLLGVEAHHFGRDRMRHFNSAAFVDRQGRLLARYDKMHPVLFGEYVPLAKQIPWLAEMTPLGEGLTDGQEPVAVAVGPVLAAPNICYESVLPHVIRRPILALREQGREPNVLVNLTNDGWFYGSSELDLHLTCGVFRAVECRKPLLIAANTGFSAIIDGDGRLRAMGPRHATGTVLAEVRPDPRDSLYLRYGDWPAGACLAACVVLAAVAWWPRRRAGRPECGVA
jgi:apolipoprotein N-acyltransferase